MKKKKKKKGRAERKRKKKGGRFSGFEGHLAMDWRHHQPRELAGWGGWGVGGVTPRIASQCVRTAFDGGGNGGRVHAWGILDRRRATDMGGGGARRGGQGRPVPFVGTLTHTRYRESTSF